MTILNTFKAISRGAVVALALGAASVVAMPATAMAQSFEFNFPIAGGDGNFSFGIGRDGVRVRRACMNDREIRNALRDEGWRNIEFRGERRNSVRVLAEWRRTDRLYGMNVNRCNGRISDVERVRRGGGGGGGRGGPGVEFQFNIR